MPNAVLIPAVVVLLAVVVAIHEAGHFRVMRQLGVAIEAVGAGLPLGPALVFSRPPTEKAPNPVEVRLHPLLIGGYVMPTDEGLERMESLPYRDQAWIYNVGIVANLATGFGFLAVADLLNGRYAAAALNAVLAAATWAARRSLAAYVLPTVGAVAALGFVAVALYTFGRGGMRQLGMVGTGSVARDVLTSSPSVLVGVFHLAGILSLALAVYNMLPLYGLDNGKSVDLALKNAGLGVKARTGFQLAGTVAIVALVGVALVSDLLNLLPS